MYKEHLLSKQSKISGLGTFTTIDIPANCFIVELNGKLFSKEDNIVHDEPGSYLQVTNKWYIGPSGSKYDFINHSCDPNCYVSIIGKRAFLYSIYLIKSNTELTFDYSISSTDTLDDWSMSCNCKSYKCRKVISGFKYLDDKLKEEYKNKSIIPLFITNPMIRG